MPSKSPLKGTPFPPSLYAAWAAVAFYYCYQYVLRVAPGVLVTPLRESFGLTAEQFASLGAIYLYVYALSQIPFGYSLDRYGNRRVVLVSMGVCVAGAFLFAFSASVWQLQCARFLMGLGSASAFMCALKAVIDDLPAPQRGFWMGTTLMLGTLGALIAGEPLVLLSHAWGWRRAMHFVAVCGLFLWVCSYLLVPETPAMRTPAEGETRFLRRFHVQLNTLWEVCRTPWVLWYAGLSVALYAPLSVVADLWGVAFVMEKYGASHSDASQITMMMYFGLGLGCLLWPILAQYYQASNRVICVCVCGVALLFGLLLWGPLLSLPLLILAFSALGLFCGAEILCFVKATSQVFPARVGLTLGVVNTLNMLGAAILDQIIGAVLDARWVHANRVLDVHGLRLYTTTDYQWAFTALCAVLVLGVIGAWVLPSDSPSQ